MINHRLQGSWDQLKGIGMEILGEMRGDARLCAAGQKERMLGQLEIKRDLSRKAAEQALQDELH